MAKETIIGIDVGTSSIKIVSAENRDKELHILGATQKPSAGLKRGYLVDQNLATEAIRYAVKEAERISNTTIKQAYISINGVKLESIRSKGMVIVSRADTEISESDVKRAITQAENNLSRIANRDIIHRIPISYKIDGENVFGRPIGMKGEKLEADVLFVVCMNQHFLDIVESVRMANIEIEDVIAAPIAASNAVLNKRQKEVGCILVNIGAETTSIAIFEEGNLLSLEVFPFGSSHITNDIALGLQISLEEAEELKFGYEANNQKKKLADIIEARLGDIFELIENHLKKINRNGLLPAGIILTGGGANLIGIEDFSKKALRLPAKIGTPCIPIKTHDKQIYNPKWSTALGLCVSEISSDINSNKPALGIWISFLRWLKSFLP